MKKYIFLLFILSLPCLSFSQASKSAGHIVDDSYDFRPKMNIEQVKENVRKMALQNAPMEDIDGYIEAAGYTVDEIRRYKPLSEFAPREEAYTQGFGDTIFGKALMMLLTLMFILLLFFLGWLIFFKLLPKFIYTLRRAWLEAAFDAKNNPK